MLKGQNIICISSIDWDFIWQGHQEIMSDLAKEGNRVLFIENTGVRVPGIKDASRIIQRIKNWFTGIEGIRKEADSLYIFSPLVLPFPYSRITLWINRRLIMGVLEKWVKIMNFAEPVIWVFLPTPLSLDIIENLKSKTIIYYCIDNFRVSSTAAKKIRNSEIRLLKKADLVFATSSELYNYCLQYNRKVHYFPFAVNFAEFEKERLVNNPIPEELKKIPAPIVGYIGGVHKWIDLDLIREAAREYPDYSFVFVGPIQTDVSKLVGLKNVIFLGKNEHKKIPLLINNFSVCIIPYLITEYTSNVYPTKLNEYLAMGKPVISTYLAEVVNFNRENDNLVLIARGKKDFMDCIYRAINEESLSLREKRIAVAKKNSWTKRIEEMSALVEQSIKDKGQQIPDWKESFLKLYRSSRKKGPKLLFVFSVLYLIIFYTPLVWILANPLKIAQPPQKADCIVVFAGGVGESGKAGQGYEERVEQAVELYRGGYARNIIFSSGYIYVFKEPSIMKALAVSLGVPEEAIILEDTASGTYENVKFSHDILVKNGWRRIILVSSPYHMLRASLVFKKVDKNIEVIYVPTSYSLFYAHPEEKKLFGKKILKWTNIQQIRSIIHEYLAILYYWWKGRI